MCGIIFPLAQPDRYPELPLDRRKLFYMHENEGVKDDGPICDGWIVNCTYARKK
jgi:hypothetical protein